MTFISEFLIGIFFRYQVYWSKILSIANSRDHDSYNVTYHAMTSEEQSSNIGKQKPQLQERESLLSMPFPPNRSGPPNTMLNRL